MLRKHIYFFSVCILFSYISFAWGTEGIPRISVSPKSINFGSLRVGGTSATKAVAIRNKGTEDLIINSITISGSNQSEFTQTNNCSTIPAKSSCVITVIFAPISPFGGKSAILSILSNDPKKSTVIVKVAGQAPPPKISISHKSVNFGSVIVGNTSPPKILRIKNTGISDLTISSIVITGANASEFSQTNNCSAMAKGDTCTVAIIFSPTSSGRKRATIDISSNDPKKPTVNEKLEGNAKSCTYTLSSASQQFDALGGSGSVSVTSQSGCNWSATNNSSWIKITSGSIGSGDGTITFTVEANTTNSQRSGTITIDGQTLTVTQAGAPTTGDPLDNWHLRLIETSFGFIDAAFGNGIYVGVGTEGSISTSSDTRKWAIRSSGTSNDLNAVVFANGLFVVVGANGTILSSADGAAWTSETSGTSVDLFKVTFGNGEFVAVGYGGMILASPDGANWTQPMILHQPVNAIIFGNGIFVVVGDNGAIFTSTDAKVWMSRSSGTFEHLGAITFGNGLFVAAGSGGTFVTSADGTAWSVKNLQGNDFEMIVYGNGIFVAATRGFTSPRCCSTTATSTDGVNWTTMNQSFAVDAITFGNDIFLSSMGISAPAQVGGSSFVSTSFNGIEWTSRHLFTVSGSNYHRAQLTDGITFGNGLFVAVGGARLTSADGVEWSVIATDDVAGLSQVVYANGVFVAVGEGGAVVTSTDGDTWTVRTSGTSNNLSGIASNGATFVAVGEGGTILTSPDGVNWTTRTSGTVNSLFSVTYGNGIFAAVGDLGEIVTSQDGLNWQRVNSGVLDELLGIAYGNGRFVAVSYGGIITSFDTITWVKTSQNLSPSGISFCDGFFVAVVGADGSGGVITSPDGISWKARVLPPDFLSELSGAVTFGDGSFVLGGNAIYQSDHL